MSLIRHSEIQIDNYRVAFAERNKGDLNVVLYVRVQRINLILDEVYAVSAQTAIENLH